MSFIAVILILTLFPIVFCYNNFEKDPIVEIRNGKVRGSKISENLYGFRGIPYAKPPINDLRFEPPREADIWDGIWNATYDRNDCYQVHLESQLSLLNPEKTNGDEDCLYINIYTPQLPDVSLSLPVMVWVYGGAFLYGTSKYTTYAPDDIVKQGVIVVSFNYRLGVFGFLSTGDKEAPGNAAIKDQIFALKWVQRNIQAFGGDPNRVTIFGESAGSASVSYLVISPLTKGLFQNAIMESGTALCLWSLSRTAKEAAFHIGNELRIGKNDSKVLVNELKKIPAEQLLKISQRVMSLILVQNPLAGLVYAPVLEATSETSVLTESSYELLAKGMFNKVPVIIGYNSAEAEGFADTINLIQAYLKTYDLKPSLLVPVDMHVNEEYLNNVGEQIKDYYAGSEGQLSNPPSNFKSFLSDDQFVRPIQKTAALMAYHTDVYLYKFSYTSNVDSVGAGHAEELDYLFKSARNSTTDESIRNCMVELWTNFAKYNDPTPSNVYVSCTIVWKPINPKKRRGRYFVNIDRSSVLARNPDRDSMLFWEVLYETYGNFPYETY